MGRSDPRVAASAAAIAAFLLLGGTAMPVVSADPGHSRDGNGDGRGGYGRDDLRRGGGPDRANGPNRGFDPDRSTDFRRDRGFDGGPSSEFDRDRSTEGQRTDGPARPDRGRSGSSSRQSSAGQASAPPGDSAPTGGGGGSGATAPPTGPITAPRVTVGNGRSPGILSGQRKDAPSPAGPVDVPAPPVAPPPPVVAPTTRIEPPKLHRAVSSLWAAAASPSQPDGVVFGIAGLLLAPIAGAWLGYRQARASRAAAQLVRR